MKYQKYLSKFQTLEGKNIIITGANSGIGFETCKYVLALKGNVIMACRNLNKAEDAKNKLLEEFPSSNIKVYQYDQASLSSIENFVHALKENKVEIDGLICNAGVYYPKKDMKTIDGFELTIGTNYIGTSYLLDSLKDVLNNKRVVVVSSLTATLAKDYGLENIDKLSRNKLYGFSKFLLCKNAYERIYNESYELVVVHPGICATNILTSKDTGLSSWFSLLGRKFLNIFVHSASKAALILIEGLLCSYQKGLYIKPRGPFAISGYPTIKKLPKKFKSEGLIQKTRVYTQKVGKDVISK